MDAASLRQRFQSGGKAAASTSDRGVSMETFQQIQEQAGPLFVQAAAMYETIQPVIEKATASIAMVWQMLQPYHPQDLAVAVYGFFLVFFGGVFMTLVASAEAAHQFGWQKIKGAVVALYVEWGKAREAFERDNKIDMDRDGIADVNELNASELAARRLMVLTKSIDPENVSSAMEGLTIATVAVLATLRVRFAKAITLGTSIGNILEKLFRPYTTKVMQMSLPDDYHKWIPVMNKYGFRYFGVSLSWMLMRVITSVFAAMRGSELFITGVIVYLERHSYVSDGLFEEGSPIVVAAWGLMAGLGIYLQLSSGFRLPFPFNLLLLPLTIAEQVVVFAVGASAQR